MGGVELFFFLEVVGGGEVGVLGVFYCNEVIGFEVIIFFGVRLWLFDFEFVCGEVEFEGGGVVGVFFVDFVFVGFFVGEGFWLWFR